MKKFTLKALLVLAVAFTYYGCQKSRTVNEDDLTASTDIVVNLTGVQKWAYIEFTGTVRPDIQTLLDRNGINGNNVGQIQQTYFTIAVKNPNGQQIQNYTWFANYEFWMNVPNLDKIQCCNKTEYKKYINAGSSWDNVTATNCKYPPCSTYVIGGNYKGYVSEPSYDLTMRCWLNDTVPTTPTTTLTITQRFKVKFIK
jgi:hypothetical protein